MKQAFFELEEDWTIIPLPGTKINLLFLFLRKMNQYITKFATYLMERPENCVSYCRCLFYRSLVTPEP